MNTEQTSASELGRIGMESSYNATSDSWKQVALDSVRTVATKNFEFLADEVWQEINDRMPGHQLNGSALGGVMHQVARLGYIIRTDYFKRSQRPATHGKPLPVWRSRVFGREA